MGNLGPGDTDRENIGFICYHIQKVECPPRAVCPEGRIRDVTFQFTSKGMSDMPGVFHVQKELHVASLASSLLLSSSLNQKQFTP